MRAQIFSIDFVIAMAVLTVVIGITVQTMDNMQKRALFIETSSSNTAEVIAQNFMKPTDGFMPSTRSWAFRFSNGTGSPLYSTFTCPKHMFASTRVLACNTGGVIYHCSLTVKSCS